ncbi:MAG TPA: glycoside hydrolase family 15 protein [Steroidobacteraceae bacterium]|nr:glycoside hydrolase family 15 protein [Steroidobacteraceae bacterium]
MSASGLDEWIAAEARLATARMLGAISATHLVTERPGFGQRVTPHPGSVLASPVPAHYDPDPDYFFHWYRDSAIVIDALRVALAAGYTDPSAVARFREFVQFSLSLQALDGQEFLRRGDFRAKVQPAFLKYVRPDAEIAALSGEAVLADVRVNADGTPDFIRWSRPQTDGPALRCLALMCWWRQFPELQQDPTLRAALSEVISTDYAFTLSYVRKPCSDVWEEESGYHYYTQLVQAEALARAAEWLAESGQAARARAGRLAAEQTLARLDGFWNAPAGFYRSRIAAGSGDPARALDIAVVLAVLHAGRTGVRHSVLDPRAQATLTVLEELFETEYAINRERPRGRGPAMGRYAHDRYYSGGAWYLATLAAAEFYFRLAQALGSGAGMAVVPANARFRQRLGATEPVADGAELARLALERGDAIMRTVQAFTPESGELSEQFDQTTGAQTSAKHLSWSYAAFITTAARRAQASRSIRAADVATKPAGTA